MWILDMPYLWTKYPQNGRLMAYDKLENNEKYPRVWTDKPKFFSNIGKDDANSCLSALSNEATKTRIHIGKEHSTLWFVNRLLQEGRKYDVDDGEYSNLFESSIIGSLSLQSLVGFGSSSLSVLYVRLNGG